MGYHAHPVEIEYQSAHESLRMVFSDGHISVYPVVYLRGYCPCARCQGHSGGPAKWIEATHRRQIEVVNVEPVGGYALTITWGDGHDTGIYTFEWLRQVCPCPQCLPAGLPERERQFQGG